MINGDPIITFSRDIEKALPLFTRAIEMSFSAVSSGQRELSSYFIRTTGNHADICSLYKHYAMESEAYTKYG
jgi:hypothetical protein